MMNTDKLAISNYDGRPFVVECDASDEGVGAALLQLQDDNTTRPLAFAGRGLTDSEKKYGISERECLWMVYALQQFKTFIDNQHVIVKTDHSAPTWLKDKVRLGNRRLHMWALVLQQAFPDIRYSPGHTMTLADPLSRCDAVEAPEAFLAEMALPGSGQPEHVHRINSLNIVQQDLLSEQKKDPILREIVEYLENNKLPVRRNRRRTVMQQAANYCIRNNLLYKQNRIAVPQTMQQQILRQAHDSPLGGHLGED